MKRGQLILIVVSIVLIAALYQLPTVVVKNETDTAVEMHSMDVSDTDATAIQSLRLQIEQARSENLTNFADSLARYYLKYGYLDSAVQVGRRYLMGENSSLEVLSSAGYIFYSAFERAQTTEEATERIELANQAYSRVVVENPKDLMARTRLAMTLVTSQNPMQGITMLREVLEIDPDYREAILNLGLLSIRSGQFEKAVERFEKLLSMDSLDYEAMLYNGVALQEIDKNIAKEYFERIAEAPEADPAIVVTAQQYLEN
jgi:tetratricopeptide (TPR) repeat protein